MRVLHVCVAGGLLWLLAALPTHTYAQQASHTSLSSVATGTAGRGQPSVEIFATTAMDFANSANATVYRLDGIRLLEQEMSAGLPPDEATAMRMAQARMKQMGGQFAERVRNAGMGQIKAKGYGVQRMPAMVINGKAIVYGTTDVAVALAMVRDGRFTPAQGPGLPPGVIEHKKR